MNNIMMSPADDDKKDIEILHPLANVQPSRKFSLPPQYKSPNALILPNKIDQLIQGELLRNDRIEVSPFMLASSQEPIQAA